MTVLYDVERYGPFLDVEWHEECIIKDEQLAALYLLELCLQIAPFVFATLSAPSSRDMLE